MNKLKYSHATCQYTFLSIVMIIAGVAFGFSQQKTVTGNVTDENGVPLPGATIIELGTTNGTSTDFDGNFQIVVEDGGDLIITYVGYADQRVPLTNADNYNIRLQLDTQLEEVVVTTAYGEQRKSSIVGSISTITNELIENVQSTSVIGAIQGSIPGVNILTQGGVPGTNPQLWIRGTSSINADPNPLYVVDGVPFSGNTNSIPSYQVKSISVLKDASATALYGARGANGVVLITTRRGKLNTKPRVVLDSHLGVNDNAIKIHETLNGKEYMELTWEALKNSKIYGVGKSAGVAAEEATDELIGHLGYNSFNIAKPVGTDGKLDANAKELWDTDWNKALFRNTGSRSEHSLSVTGGGAHTSYFMNLNYLKEDGQVRTTFFERISARLTQDTDVNDWLKFGTTIGYTTSEQGIPDQDGTSYQSAVQWVYSVSSIYPLYRRDPSGNLIKDNNGNLIYDYGNNAGELNASRPVFSGENARGALEYYEIGNNRTNLALNGNARIKFHENLWFRTAAGYQRAMFDLFQYTHNEYGFAESVGGRVSQDRILTSATNTVQQLNYNNNFGDHSLEADMIYEAFQVKLDALGAQGTGFLPNIKVLNGSTTPESVTGSITEERILGLLGRVRYNYKGIYFAEASYRRDASTRFKKENRWGDFYAVGLAYLISREPFFKLDEFNYLKIKASYGVLGNNRGIGFFPYLQGFATGWNQLGNTGIIAQGIVDPNIRWEKTSSLNVGLEFGMLSDNRLQGEINYYNKASVDLIYDRPLAPSTGNSSISTNEGALRNYGVEFSLGYRIIDADDFYWDAETNFSIDKNKITKLTQDEFISGSKKWVEGRSLYDFFIREWAGVDPEDGSALWYKDVLDDDGNPTGEKEKTKEYSEATRYFVNKKSIPSFIGGLSSRIKYKQFDFSFRMNFSFGSYLYDSTYSSLMASLESAGRQGHKDLLNRWQKPGDKSNVPKVTTENNDYNSRSTRFLFKNDFIRLKDIEIGYSLGSSATERLKIDRFRIYLRGNNLFNYQTVNGIDAEQSINGLTNNRSYALRTVALGIRLNL